MIRKNIFTFQQNKNDTAVTGRKIFLLSCLLFIFFIIIARAFYFQVFKFADTEKRADSTVNKEIIEKPKRGDILDRNGNILAMSVKKYSLFLDGKNINDTAKITKILNDAGIQLSKKQMTEINKKNRNIKITDDLDEISVEKIKENKKFLIGHEYKLTYRYVRLYPETKMLSHVLGRVNSDGKGIEGIEKTCDNHLTGNSLKISAKEIGGINKKRIYTETPNENSYYGKTVTLTIDKKIQFIAEQELQEGLKKNKAKHAVAIVQDPHSGEILAMVSLPNYNPGKKIKDISVLRNYAISGTLEPGSTFKIIALAGVLEEHLFKPTDRIDCMNGKMEIYKNVVISDHEKQKVISLARVMEVSSNIGTAKIALALGEDRFYKYIKIFGFDSKTGIELNGEENGVLKPTKTWSGRSLHTISFGQEILTTPLQTVNSFSAIANNGLLLKPQIIKSIDCVQQSTQPVSIRRAVSEDTAFEIRKILKGVVDKGTGAGAKIEGYTAGGKTGTAQKIDKTTGKYSKKHYVSSFCGMIPAMEPKLVILVLFDEPQGDYYASSVAAPVFAKIAQRTMQYLNIPKDEIGVKKNKE
ncbi:MAG: penicillin-binding protein 2 [Endomicrobiaceae bacterium]|jgi:cell division protein FtsI (penicillin-binding protein 3)|nr:penicillin-binding protein 2 [Endomicrobiaceae bacterium]MDD3730389.1 penicillin-binding protein 2 [Endomicrobiaceae bacterium]MDD4166291.1 penicillin-binding protein 2 [Endomicrobiaceae bacterium]